MNRVTIEPTEFTNVRTGQTSRGFRAWDDEDQSYDNSWDEIPTSDEAFLKKVFKESYDKNVGNMLDFCRQYKQGIFVGVNYFPWEKIETLLAEVEAERESDAKSEKH